MDAINLTEVRAKRDGEGICAPSGRAIDDVIRAWIDSREKELGGEDTFIRHVRDTTPAPAVLSFPVAVDGVPEGASLGDMACVIGAARELLCDTPRVAAWVAERAIGNVDGANFAAGVARNGELAAGFLLYGWNGAQALLSVRIDDPRAPTRAWWSTMWRYPFDELGARCVRATVLETNVRCLALCANAGMREEYRLRDAHPGGVVVMFSMRREHCRFLTWR